MGVFKKMFKHAQEKGEEFQNKLKPAEPPAFDPANPPTRWEKAVVGLNGIVQQVSLIDPDGVDVYCIPGAAGDADVYRNIKDVKGLEALVTAKEPAGKCMMGKAMDTVLTEAFTKGFDERPCSILVMTAGRPDDHEELSNKIAEAAKKVKKVGDLTITFVQVGDDDWAEKYLKHLDEGLKVTNDAGEEIDIVDTIKDEEIKAAVGEFKDEGFIKSGGGGALFGAFAGAALGVGGMYLYNKMNAKKRTAGWNGKWKAMIDGEEIAVLTVTDDMAGKLDIVGWPEDKTCAGEYAENEEGGFNIQFADPDEREPVVGTIQDEHTIDWSDGTRWEEVPPDGGHWAAYAGAAAAGAASAGAAGYLMQKKFFKKASDQVPSDYVIIMDRSAMMAIPDTGK